MRQQALGAKRLIVLSCDQGDGARSAWLKIKPAGSSIAVSLGRLAYSASCRLFERLLEMDLDSDLSEIVDAACRRAGYTLNPETGSARFVLV
jgi:hypothetical protein